MIGYPEQFTLCGTTTFAFITFYCSVRYLPFRCAPLQVKEVRRCEVLLTLSTLTHRFLFFFLLVSAAIIANPFVQSTHEGNTRLLVLLSNSFFFPLFSFSKDSHFCSVGHLPVVSFSFSPTLLFLCFLSVSFRQVFYEHSITNSQSTHTHTYLNHACVCICFLLSFFPR